MMKMFLSSILIVGLMTSCQMSSNKAEKAEIETDSTATPAASNTSSSFQDCDVTMCGIHFTKMWNNADKCVSETPGDDNCGGVITFTAPEQQV